MSHHTPERIKTATSRFTVSDWSVLDFARGNALDWLLTASANCEGWERIESCEVENLVILQLVIARLSVSLERKSVSLDPSTQDEKNLVKLD